MKPWGTPFSACKPFFAYSLLRISKNWVAENTAPHPVNLTLETTWNSPHSTQEGYLKYGAALGRAIANYLIAGQ